MILLVPFTPEVPKRLVPVLWPALLILLLLGLGFLASFERIQADFEYISSLRNLLTADKDGKPQLTEEAHAFLKKRPLIAIAPAKGDWDVRRLIFANFLHGSLPHLVLNWIGVFAGARICTTFLPFLCTLSIFILGGSLGLLTSMWLSAETSAFIPHIGASGGIFALMGAYYVYNYRFRTRYFFWFPSRHGTINLRTSWFFFLDVILLELVLSTGQFLPTRVDSVDHLAHVVGFASGVALAFILRFFQRWPAFIQTRAEYHYWTKIPRTKPGTSSDEILQKAFTSWSGLLDINPCNDLIKNHLCQLIARHPTVWTSEQIDHAFRFLSPTFLRLQTDSATRSIGGLLKNHSSLPAQWLASTPYDSIIRLAQSLARDPELQAFLFDLVSQYRRAHPEGGNTERKLELLMTRLSTLQPPPNAVAPASPRQAQ